MLVSQDGKSKNSSTLQAKIIEIRKLNPNANNSEQDMPFSADISRESGQKAFFHWRRYLLQGFKPDQWEEAFECQLDYK